MQVCVPAHAVRLEKDNAETDSAGASSSVRQKLQIAVGLAATVSAEIGHEMDNVHTSIEDLLQHAARCDQFTVGRIRQIEKAVGRIKASAGKLESLRTMIESDGKDKPK